MHRNLYFLYCSQTILYDSILSMEITMTNNDWLIQYEQLKSWVESKNYTVTEKWGVEDCIVFEDQEIFINSRCKPENMFYTLLHECGHYLLDKSKETFKETHPVYPSDVDDKRIEIKNRFYNGS